MTANIDQLLPASQEKTAQDGLAFPARWRAYLAERFPLLAYGLLILSFYSSNQFLAHALTAPGEPMRYDVSSLLGGLVLLLIFLQLRIFDDLKDFVDDCRHFPERMLQRNVVTRRDLKLLLVLVIATQFAIAAWRGPGALASVILVHGFSLLMLKEFFAREWLRRRFVVYASTHMLIIPLLAIFIFSFATGRFPWQATPWYWQYAFVGYCVAFNWEVSRKIRAPNEEIDGVDSYTKRFGTYGAAYIVLGIRVLDTALVMLLAIHLGFSLWFHMWLVVLFAICLIGFFQFRFQTTPATARRMQAYAGFYIVAFDLALAVELVRTYGIVIRWGST